MDSESEDEAEAIVIDNGSTFVKIGYAGDDAPKHIIPSISIPINNNIDDDNTKEVHPIQRGKIVDWQHMEKLWNYTIKEKLKEEPSGQSILLSEPVLNPMSNKQKMTEIMFETFNVHRLYIAHKSELAQYASGRTTGVILSSGGDVTYVCPVYEGNCLSHAVNTLNIGGNDVNKCLQRMLSLKQKIAITDIKTINDIKEKLCFVCPNDLIPTVQDYKLPDGNIIKINSKQVLSPCTDILFKPDLLFKINNVYMKHVVDAYIHQYSKQFLYEDIMNLCNKFVQEEDNLNDGFCDLIYKSIMKCDIDIRRCLFSNIILSGGNTMFSGLCERLKCDMTTLATFASDNYKGERYSWEERYDNCGYKSIEHSWQYTAKVIAPCDRKFSVWIGGSILASLTIASFAHKWITKQDYNEFGPSIVHQKCI